MLQTCSNHILEICSVDQNTKNIVYNYGIDREEGYYYILQYIHVDQRTNFDYIQFSGLPQINIVQNPTKEEEKWLIW